MRPNFEEPLDTAKQLVEQNITLYLYPHSTGWREFMLESSNPEYRILAENMIIAKDWRHFDEMSKYGVMENGTHALLIQYLDPFDKAWGTWHRSKEMFEGDNYYTFLSNKKWHLNEVIILH